MRKLSTLFFVLIASISLMATEGALNGKFTINANGDQIVFSQGNLQYVGTWQFATNQWDYFGTSQSDNHRDLFGWGTGDAPNRVGASISEYSTFTDWGTNAITNGGNEANLWRTLTKDELFYLFYGRVNANILFGLGSVNGVNGTILLPDNWVLPTGASFTASTTQGLADGSGYGSFYFVGIGGNFSHNTYSTEQWEVMESAGAVFLPAAGFNYQTYVYSIGSAGYYWSATPYYTKFAYYLLFNSTYLMPQATGEMMRPYGQSVRLVQAASASDTPSAIDNTSFSTKAVKHIVNGQLYILLPDGTRYTATGQLVK